jgi:hypothetical protein
MTKQPYAEIWERKEKGKQQEKMILTTQIKYATISLPEFMWLQGYRFKKHVYKKEDENERD